MKKKLKKFLTKKIGPGFITGASDDDPSGIGTYSQTGAMFGYGQLWTALFSFPFMSVMQEISGRIGLVTGKGLSGIIKKHYSKKILYFAVLILFLANVINIGANLGAMAVSIKLLINAPFVLLLLIITATTLFLEIFVSYQVYSGYLKYLTFSLFAYIGTVFIVKQDWSLIFTSTVRPTFIFSKDYLMNIVAILGTTISPYLFFWQASEEVEEEVREKKLKNMGNGRPKINIRTLRHMKKDTIIGMFFSNLIMFFIMITVASTLHANGVYYIETAAQAAVALRPFAGDLAFLLFALGIVGSGLLAVPVLAGAASYAFAEACGWREGLYLKFRQAHGFYGVIILATLMGLLINLTPITPFQMLYYTAVLNGLVAPLLMIIIMSIGNDKKIMGKYTNSFLTNFFGWLVTIFMSCAAIALIITIILNK